MWDIELLVLRHEERLDLNPASARTLANNQTNRLKERNRTDDHCGHCVTRSQPTGIRTARDLTLLLGRVGLAVLMIAHAKLEYDYGGSSISGVGRLFEQAGVPLAALTGPANLLLEAIGGVALILGLAVRAVGVLIALNMLGAWVLVHPTALYAADHTGPETVIAIGLLSLVLAATGSGLRALRARPSDRPSQGRPSTVLRHDRGLGEREVTFYDHVGVPVRAPRSRPAHRPHSDRKRWPAHHPGTGTRRITGTSDRCGTDRVRRHRTTGTLRRIRRLDAARVIEAVHGRVPVGHVAYALESLEGAARYKSAFAVRQ